MKRKLMRTFGAMALSLLANSSWAQQAGTRPQTAQPAVTVGVVGQNDTQIEIAPVPQVVGSPHPGPVINGDPNGYGPGNSLDCNGCGQSCGQSSGRFIVGAGVYVLQPRWESNLAFQIATTPVGNNDNRTLQEFDHGSGIAPTAIIGYECASGLGIRGHWFSFSSDDTQSFTNIANTFVTPANSLGLGVNATGVQGAVISATSDLSLYVFDLEATKRITNNCWSLLMSAGVRYGHIDQDYNYLSVDPDTSSERIVNQHSFNGIGPTFSLEGRAQIGGSGLALYGNGRGSVLFGKRNESATQTVTNAAGTVTELDTGSASRNSILSIGELEVGAEYGCDLGKCRLVGQVGFVGQIWWGAGNSANVDGSLNANNSANLGLVGVVFRAGINF